MTGVQTCALPIYLENSVKQNVLWEDTLSRARQLFRPSWASSAARRKDILSASGEMLKAFSLPAR